ncbi:hypothetical protein ACIGDM_01075 [Rothia koreensis]|uniref:hypothetical protein n=1 Tax=Rothia koreensis TaxID=592378 RepID=UPI0037CB7B2D
MAKQRSIHDLLAEYEAALEIRFAQRRLEFVRDRVSAAHQELEDATSSLAAAETELDRICSNHPDVRPPQVVAADLVKGHEDQ